MASTHHQKGDLHHKGSIAQEVCDDADQTNRLKGVFLTHMEHLHALFNGLVGRNCRAASIEHRDTFCEPGQSQDQSTRIGLRGPGALLHQKLRMN